jgi:hypothetical protein
MSTAAYYRQVLDFCKKRDVQTRRVRHYRTLNDKNVVSGKEEAS